MFDKEIFRLDVFGAFRTGDIPVFSEGESTHVVLINDICLDCISLSLKEVSCPKYITDFIEKPNEFALT